VPVESNPLYFVEIHFNTLTSGLMSTGWSLSFRFSDHYHLCRNKGFHEQLFFIEVISVDQRNLSYGNRRFVVIIKKPSIGFHPEPAHSG
jgi:hypothetical protein